MTITLPVIIIGLVITGVIILIATYYATEIGRGLLIVAVLIIILIIAFIVLSFK